MLQRLWIPLLALLVFPTLQESGCTPQDCDTDKDGFDNIICAEEPGTDCDDGDASVYPGALEACDDTVDRNCDGQLGGGDTVYQDLDGDGVGNGAVTDSMCGVEPGWVETAGDCDDTDPLLQDYRFFRDADGDGYGLEVDVQHACEPPVGYAPARGDCDDTDPAIHPFAGEVSDSDGVDQDCGGTDGPSPQVQDPLASIQAALDASSHGQTIWVGPGVYQEHDLDFKGKKVRLASVGLQERTVIDAQGLGRGFYFHTAETTASVVDGWTVRQGKTSTSGGGMYFSSSSPSLSQVTLVDNSAEDYGGGMYLYTSSPSLNQVTLVGNSAYIGGGMNLFSSSPSLSQVTLVDNSAEGDGGGMHLAFSSPSLSQVTLSNNAANGHYGNGGGMFLYDSSPSLSQVTLVGNSAERDGGGMYIKTYGSRPVLKNTILAYNLHYNLYNYASDPGAPTLAYSALYAPPGQPNHNLSSLPSTNLTVEPGFVFYSPNRDPSDDDLHLQPDSPLRHAGDPDTSNPDGSRADIGAYGGQGASFDYYADTDLDGLYDGWEQAWLGGLEQVGSDDADEDGLSNGEELDAGTLASAPDTDQDGASDGAEHAAGSNPLEPSSQPGGEGTVTLHVPTDFPSIQEAIDWCWYTCEVHAAAGTYTESLYAGGKSLTLVGEGPELTILEASPGERVLTVLGGTLHLERVSVTGGEAYDGGGLYLSGVSGAIINAVVHGSTTAEGCPSTTRARV